MFDRVSFFGFFPGTSALNLPPPPALRRVRLLRRQHAILCYDVNGFDASRGDPYLVLVLVLVLLSRR